MLILCGCISLLSLCPVPSSAILSLIPNKDNACYHINEKVLFSVIGASEQIDYIIYQDKFTTPLAGAKLERQAGKVEISYQFPYPGMFFCKVISNGEEAVAVVLVEPEHIEPYETEPIDFDVFWNTSKSELAAIPIDPKLSYYTEDTYSTTYRVNLAHVNNRRVYGYISIPKASGKFAAVLTLPSFGTAPNIVPTEHNIVRDAGVIAMTISIHNAEPDLQDRNAYKPNNIVNPKENYYWQAILAGIRAIDYIFSRSDFNGQLGVVGVSQGAGLTVLTAGLDERIDFIAISGTTHCEHQGLSYQKPSGFPYYLYTSRYDLNSNTAIKAAAKYYDAVYFARRFKGEVFACVGYLDEVSNVATQIAAFNQFSGPKILLHAKLIGHVHPPEYWVGRHDMLRRLFPTSRNYAWQWARSTTGYSISVGEDLYVKVGVPLALNGRVLKEQQPIALKARWEKVSGKGDVIFSDSSAYAPTVAFSEAGVYKLRFYAYDYGALMLDSKYYALVDELTVFVEDTKLTLNCPNDITTIIPARQQQVQVYWNLPDATTNCESPTVNLSQIQGNANNTLQASGQFTNRYLATTACGDSATCSFKVTVLQTDTLPGYCFAKGYKPWWEWISWVSFGAIDHNSGKEGYHHTISEETKLAIGSSYSLQLGIRYSWLSKPEFLNAYIDFNQDSLFTENELVLHQLLPFTTGLTNQLVETMVNIPDTALLGETRMRVLLSREQFADACSEYDFGEVEDYTFYVLPSSAGFTISSLSAASGLNTDVIVYPNPVTETLTAQWNPSDTEQFSWKMVNELGRVVLQGVASGNELNLTVSELPKGMYNLIIKTSFTTFVKRVVKLSEI